MYRIAVKLLAFTADGEAVLIVDSPKYPTLPGGNLDDGEAPFEGLFREVQKEEVPGFWDTLMHEPELRTAYIKSGYITLVYSSVSVLSQECIVEVGAEIIKARWEPLEILDRITFWQDFKYKTAIKERESENFWHHDTAVANWTLTRSELFRHLKQARVLEDMSNRKTGRAKEDQEE